LYGLAVVDIRAGLPNPSSEWFGLNMVTLECMHRLLNFLSTHFNRLTNMSVESWFFYQQWRIQTRRFGR